MTLPDVTSDIVALNEVTDDPRADVAKDNMA